MRDTSSVGRACFIGSVVCVGVALLVMPSFWLLGLAAGMAGSFLSGCISFDFGEVLREIPEALRRTRNEMSQAFKDSMTSAGAKVKAWAGVPHPYLPLVTILIGLYVWSVVPIIEHDRAHFLLEFGRPAPFIESGYMALLWVFGTIPIPLLAFLGLVWTGAQKVEKVYWESCYAIYLHEKKEAQADGLRQIVLTYFNVYRFAFKGLVYWAIQSVIFICWRMWKGLGIRLWFVGKFICCFGWHLFKLIHSKQRVLCGIDGTLGGLIVLWAFHAYGPSTPTATEYLTVLLFGGLIGAALGVANWELVSVRWLKLSNAQTPTT